MIERYLSAKADMLRSTTFEATARYLRQHFAGLHRLPIGSIKRAESPPCSRSSLSTWAGLDGARP